MNYTISEIVLDPANKYRVRVIINEHQSQFFKFDQEPTIEEINNAVEHYIKNIVDA
jgi:hypothetical protein